MLILALAVVKATVSLILDILMFMMFMRAIFSWFPGLSESSLGEFLFTLTEWVITPVRILFDAMRINVPMMIDIPFFVTFLLLSVVSSLI